MADFSGTYIAMIAEPLIPRETKLLDFHATVRYLQSGGRRAKFEYLLKNYG